MIPLSAPTGASHEGSAAFGEKEPRSDKEKDKGEKSNRDKSAPQGQATGTLHFPWCSNLTTASSVDRQYDFLTAYCPLDEINRDRMMRKQVAPMWRPTRKLVSLLVCGPKKPSLPWNPPLFKAMFRTSAEILKLESSFYLYQFLSLRISCLPSHRLTIRFTVE